MVRLTQLCCPLVFYPLTEKTSKNTKSPWKIGDNTRNRRKQTTGEAEAAEEKMEEKGEGGGGEEVEQEERGRGEEGEEIEQGEGERGEGRRRKEG